MVEKITNIRSVLQKGTRHAVRSIEGRQSWRKSFRAGYPRSHRSRLSASGAVAVRVAQLSGRRSPVCQAACGLGWRVHPPKAQFLICLKGHLEVTVSNGEKRTFGPGDSVLMEDIAGKGHRTRVKGTEECIAAIIPIAVS
jgi:quercetin dioxygenase-like cupin family protein